MFNIFRFVSLNFSRSNNCYNLNRKYGVSLSSCISKNRSAIYVILVSICCIHAEERKKNLSTPTTLHIGNAEKIAQAWNVHRNFPIIFAWNSKILMSWDSRCDVMDANKQIQWCLENWMDDNFHKKNTIGPKRDQSGKPNRMIWHIRRIGTCIVPYVGALIVGSNKCFDTFTSYWFLAKIQKKKNNFYWHPECQYVFACVLRINMILRKFYCPNDTKWNMLGDFLQWRTNEIYFSKLLDIEFESKLCLLRSPRF
jgi:hypothetical protein